MVAQSPNALTGTVGATAYRRKASGTLEPWSLGLGWRSSYRMTVWVTLDRKGLELAS
jgi:hypothetical protein